MRILQKYSVLLAILIALPLLLAHQAWAQDAQAEIENTISDISLEAEGAILVSGSIASSSNRGPFYIQAVLSDKDGITRDRIQSRQALIPGSSYEERFKFGLSPVTSDRVILMTVTESGIPFDIDPLQIKWSSDTPEARTNEILDIISCEHQDASEELVCSYRGEVDTQSITVRLYDGQPYTATQIAETTSLIQEELDGELVLSAFAKPQEDGLYIYTITDDRGTLLHQGSVRRGAIPGFEKEQSLADQEKQDQQRFLMILGALSLAFFTAVMMLSQFLLNPKKTRWIWIGVGALILAFLSVWYVAYAATYQSTNYPQYQYVVDVTPIDATENVDGDVIDTTYIISFSAFDTYTGNAPMEQKVDITFDGSTYQAFIRDESGEVVHSRQVTIAESEKNTSALKVVDGCGSYYQFSEAGTDVYGSYDCSPYPLFNLDATIGCMNPNASNYDPSAIISSGQCNFGGCIIPSALNYNPSATIDDGSCVVEGCVNPEATNYDPKATIDDGSCLCGGGSCEDVYGCTNPESSNFNELATIDDGSCDNCMWIPIIPDPSTFCATEIYYQTNSCTKEVRTVQGNLQSKWLPDISANDICIGDFVTQTEQCSPLDKPATRVLEGTSNSPFCFAPITEFEVSTNLTNWTSCEKIGRIQMTHPSQELYLRPSGTEPVDSWAISQEAGEISGSVSSYKGDVWKAQFNYLVEQKQFNDVSITMRSPAGNEATQLCNISLLSFSFEER
ncbi:MAG: hypothetical protein ACKKL4_02840 [Patescibacteria group bacterium]